MGADPGQNEADHAQGDAYRQRRNRLCQMARKEQQHRAGQKEVYEVRRFRLDLDREIAADPDGQTDRHPAQHVPPLRDQDGANLRPDGV